MTTQAQPATDRQPSATIAKPYFVLYVKFPEAADYSLEFGDWSKSAAAEELEDYKATGYRARLVRVTSAEPYPIRRSF